MSKTVKNLIIAFTMVCVVVFAIFLIELMMLNRGNGEGSGPETNIPANPPATGGDPSAGGQTPGTGQQGGAGEPDDPDSTDDTRPPPVGKRHELELPADLILVVYADDELFEFSQPESEDILGVFSFKGRGTAMLEIRFVFMPQGASEFAEGFLSDNYDIENAVVGVVEPIGDSQISGLFVEGTKDGTTFEVWIYSFPNPEVEGAGLAFVITYQNDTHMYNLNDILDSLHITHAAGD